jgi:integrase/recombinase XerC
MRNPHVPADPRDMELIDAYLEHLRRAGKADSTIDGRREILGRLDRDLPYGIGQTTKTELATWLYRDGWSRNTKYTYYCCIKDFYGWAADPRDPWISGNPAAELEKVTNVRGVPRPVADEHLRRILTEAREPYRTWALIAAYEGLRCIEISRLDREHITEQMLIVVKGKGGKPRVHDTDPIVWAAVKDLPPGPVARHPGSGERATAFYVSSKASTYFRRTMKIPASLHKMRHWLGVNLQARYKNMRVTQAALGHESIQSTQIYTDATAEEQRAARATLPRLAG